MTEEAKDDDEKELTDMEFDEAVFMGDDRKTLKDLTPEQAAEEVRYTLRCKATYNVMLLARMF